MADRIEQTFAAQQASERRARRFVSDASHELRTPITSLRGFTEILIRGAKDDPATAQHVLSLMKNEAERMTDLVNHLLTLARLDEGHFPTPQAIDLVDVVIGSLQEARKKAPEGYKLALDLVTQDRLQIQADSEQIKQLLLVLLDNAVKYGCAGEQKQILLLLDKRDRQIQIQVIDHGMGIAPDDLPHVFDPRLPGNVERQQPTREGNDLHSDFSERGIIFRTIANWMNTPATIGSCVAGAGMTKLM
jgi:signal transduction histidine kinase